MRARSVPALVLVAAVAGCASPAPTDAGTGWVAGPELDRDSGPEGWAVHVHLRPDAPVAYVSARGGN